MKLPIKVKSPDYWIIQDYTYLGAIGRVKAGVPVEFGGSPVRDQKARLNYIADLCAKGVEFTVEAKYL